MNSVLSTKKLNDAQIGMFTSAGYTIKDYDAITVSRLDFDAPEKIKNAIFTSQNAVRATLSKNTVISHCFCVGRQTANLLRENGQNVQKIAENAQELANFITKYYKNEAFYFFSGTRSLGVISSELNKAKIVIFDIKTYETRLNRVKIEEIFDKILFFSPSGVQSFVDINDLGNSTVFCIGQTTASEVKKHTDNIVIAENTSIESTIDIALNTILNND